jgi:hypothetical protein
MMEPRDPEPMSRIKAVIYAVSLPLGLFLLVFLPAGSIFWRPGWVFLAVLVFAFGVSALIIWRVNPVIYRARSRFQPGTKGWDKTLLAIMLPAMVAILPVAAMDSGRFHWSRTPGWAVLLGYGLVLAGIAGTGWAQAVNPFFEPGVRIQADRQRTLWAGSTSGLYFRDPAVLWNGACPRFLVGARPGHACNCAPHLADVVGGSTASVRAAGLFGLCGAHALATGSWNLVKI